VRQQSIEPELFEKSRVCTIQRGAGEREREIEHSEFLSRMDIALLGVSREDSGGRERTVWRIISANPERGIGN